VAAATQAYGQAFGLAADEVDSELPGLLLSVVGERRQKFAVELVGSQPAEEIRGKR